MKVATFKDGTSAERKTHTRDYQYAYKVLNSQNKFVVGFSVNKNSAIKNAEAEAKFSLVFAKKRNRLHNTPISQELIEATEQRLASIEIVECETL